MKLKLGRFEFSLGKQKPSRRQLPQQIKGKYDAAQTSNMNKMHWLNADGNSADEANNPDVRRVLRNRSRYERANNPYLDGLCTDMAAHVWGTGARLNFQDPDPEVNRLVQLAFMDWFIGASMPDKFLTGYTAKVGDGEMFLVETDQFNQRSPVTLNYKLLECERCTAGFKTNTKNNVDGVILDDQGVVVGYTFSKEHPGGTITMTSFLPNDLETFRADQVIHLFDKTRPEQHRGVPEITSALPVGSKLRAFTLATLEAAKIAATFSGVLHTTGDAWDDQDSEGPDGDFESFDTFALDNGMMLTLPEGWDMTQAKAEHPTTTYRDFKRELVAESAKSVGIPYNIAAGDSSDFNYASGNLDHLSFELIVEIRRAQVDNNALWMVFMKWFGEAVLIEGHLPEVVRMPGYQPRFQWFYDGSYSSDPQKQATAIEKRLSNGSTTHFDVYSKEGQDVRVKFGQIAEARKLARELDIEDIVFPPKFQEVANDGNDEPEEAPVPRQRARSA